MEKSNNHNASHGIAMYKIIIEKSARRFLERLMQKDRMKIIALIDKLKENPRPHGCKKLLGREEYRIRYRNYRILYFTEDRLMTVFVTEVGHHRDIYR